MKLLQISDNHIGAISIENFRLFVEKIAKEDFDILIDCGDMHSDHIAFFHYGFKAIQIGYEIINHFIPNKPKIATIGNHCLWVGPSTHKREDFDRNGNYKSYPSLEQFVFNYECIKEVFKQNNVHFINEDGVYQNKDFPGFAFVGHTGWYTNRTPPTNDAAFLPKNIEGDTFAYLYKKAYDTIDAQLVELNDMNPTLIFISHFPVM